MSEAEKRMGRDELARELRQWAREIEEIEDDDGLMNLAEYIISPSLGILRAAAALEEEERDARRYRALREFAVKSWLKSHRSCYYLRLIAAFEPFPRYGQTKLTVEEADDQFDKTLDAWLEEHGDG